MNRSKPPRRLVELLSLPTAPLLEQHVAEYVRVWSQNKPGLNLRRDRTGNLAITLRHPQASQTPTVAFVAHMDHPGFEADTMTRANRLRAHWRGGVDPSFFKDANVRFLVDTRWIKGMIRSCRLRKDKSRRRVETVSVEVDEPVPAGAIGMWDLPAPKLRQSCIHATACDDLAGVAAILSAFDDWIHKNARVHVRALLTRAEEVGFAGTLCAINNKTVSKRIPVIGIECSSALPGVEIGNGPVLRVGDRYSVFDPEISAQLRDIADGLQRSDRTFRYQRKLMDGGWCESTAFNLWGYRSGGMCLPLGNYHNMNRQTGRIASEYINLSDFDQLVQWLTALGTHRLTGRGPSKTAREKLAEVRQKYASQLSASADDFATS